MTFELNINNRIEYGTDFGCFSLIIVLDLNLLDQKVTSRVIESNSRRSIYIDVNSFGLWSDKIQMNIGFYDEIKSKTFDLNRLKHQYIQQI